MMVDDDQSILSMLTRILDLEGYDTPEAADRKTVLSLLDEFKPNLVILDVAMPEFNSLKFRNLIQQRSHTPVIMLTGTCEVTTLQDPRLLGVNNYMNRPLRRETILSRFVAKLRQAVSGNHRQN